MVIQINSAPAAENASAPTRRRRPSLRQPSNPSPSNPGPSSSEPAPRSSAHSSKRRAKPNGLQLRHPLWLFPFQRSAGFLAFGFALALVTASIFVGVYDLAGGDLGYQMIWITRVPRTAALVLAGSAMAVSGLLMQMITQNRFAEPTTTGTTEWAALGLLATTILFPTAGLVPKMLFASLAALLGTGFFLMILRRVAMRDSLVVPLIGLMLGAVVSAFTTYLALSTNLLQMLGTWFQGSFTGMVRGNYEMLWLVAGVVAAAYFAADRFTVAGLGEDLATSVGANYTRTIFVGATLVAAATGITTVVVGFLPFLGLVVPNVVSLIRGDDLRSNLPWVCWGGVVLVTSADLIGRTIRMPFEIPVAVILGVVGAAIFIYLLIRRPGASK